jgi:hypothetical protein
MPCFCTDPEEDLDDAKKEIRRLMKLMVQQIKSVRIRGYDPEVLLHDTHKLMNDIFFEKCSEGKEF